MTEYAVPKLKKDTELPKLSKEDFQKYLEAIRQWYTPHIVREIAHDRSLQLFLSFALACDTYHARFDTDEYEELANALHYEITAVRKVLSATVESDHHTITMH
jgi:hypothetical protein